MTMRYFGTDGVRGRVGTHPMTVEFALRLAVDPGFGFGKTLEHNLALLAGLPAIVGDGLPVLAGLSRKRMIGSLTGRAEGDRLAGSLAAAVVAAIKGARIIRAHDVRATVDALAVLAGSGALRDNRA